MKWESLKARGNAYVKKQQYLEADESYKQALSLCKDPVGRSSLLNNLAFSSLKQKRYSDACSYALAVLNLEPGHVKGHFRLASALWHCRGGLQAAQDVVDLGLQQAKDEGDQNELKSVLTAAHNSNGELEAAAMADEELAAVQAFIKRRKIEVSAHTNGAEPAKEDAAEARSASGLETSTSDEALAEQARLKGTECYKASNYQAAFEHYSRALELQPANVAVLGNRSAAALMLKRYETVQADCNAILALDPTYTKAYSRLSKAALGLGDLPGATTWAREACGHEPASAPLKRDLAQLQLLERGIEAASQALANGQTTTAMANARRAIDLYPDVFLQAPTLVLAEAQLKLGNAQEASNTSRKLLTNPGLCPKAALTDLHVRTLVATGNVPRAVSIYEQLYREDPDNVTTAKALKRVRAMLNGKDAGNAAFKAGKYEEAHAQYTRSLDADKDLRTSFTAQVAANRANVCLKLNRAQDAVADAKLAIESDPAYAKGYLRKAQAELQLEEFEEAVRSFTKAQEVEPSMPGIGEMLESAKKAFKKSKRVDYYKLLEIDQNSGDHDIKKAYRRAALKYHPDKAPAEQREEAEKTFKLVQEANAVLTDSQKRARYDAGWGLDEIENGFQEGARGRGGCQHHGANMEDILFSMFANGGGRGGGFQF